MAAMPIYLDNKVAHLFPLSGAREMFEPAAPLKFSFAAPYFDQIRAGIKRLVKEKGLKKVCTVYQDDDFGLEVMRGAEAGLKDIGTTYAERTTYKRGATDFSSQVAKMKEAGCDGVVMGTIIRETIGVIGTARKLDWNPVFVGTTASYSEIIHKLGGAAVNGFYSTCTVNNPYADDPNPKVKEWFAAYKGKFNEDPTVFSAYGWQIINLFATAANAAGKDLTPDSLNKAIETDQVPLRHVRRRRADLLGHQAARLRPRDAVPDPGRQVEVGVGVSDELSLRSPRGRCAVDVPSPPAKASPAVERLPAIGQVVGQHASAFQRVFAATSAHAVCPPYGCGANVAPIPLRRDYIYNLPRSVAA